VSVHAGRGSEQGNIAVLEDTMFGTVEDKFTQMGADFFRRNPLRWQESIRLHREALAVQAQARIKQKSAEGFIHQQEERTLTSSLQGAPAEYLLKLSRDYGYLYGVIAAVLIVASYALLCITFEPFPIGRIYVPAFAAGLSILCSGFMYWFLESAARKRWLQFSFAATGLGMSILANLFLAGVRGLQFAGLMQSSSTASGETGNAVITAQKFYSGATPLLQLALPLLTISSELGAGLFLHSALERIFAPDLIARKKLGRTHDKLIRIHSQIEELRTLPETFEKYATEGAINAQGGAPIEGPAERWLPIIVPIAFLLLMLFGFAVVRGFSAETPTPHPDLVMLTIDLTTSVNAQNGNGQTGYETYKVAGEEIIRQTSVPGTTFVAIGITDSSFSHPLFLLQNRIDTDPGYFGEKLQVSKKHVIDTWRQQTGTRVPSFKHTDLLGAFEEVAEIRQSQNVRFPVLIVLSDMRNNMPHQLDIETPNDIDVSSTLNLIRRQGAVPNLNGIQVYVLGAKCSDRSYRYFERLRELWTEYFKAAGAQLRLFTDQTQVKIQ
jgi:hypothetical protein